jgi:hypothetical protein
MSGRTGRYYPMPPQVRDETILALYRRGWTYERIGCAVGMSKSGVQRALVRIREGGFGEGMTRA